MKKITLITLLYFLSIFFYACATSKTVDTSSNPLLQEAIDNMVLVEGFESDGIKYNFKIGRYEVTQELYEYVMGTNPSYFSKNPAAGENQNRRPVEFVSWYDAVLFCNKLTILTMGKNECCYKITNIQYKTDDDEAAKEKFLKEAPTYVTYIQSADVTINHNKKGFRLPKRKEWSFAAKGGLKTQNYKYAGSNDLAEVAWHFANSGKKTHEVGLLKPNELGLYDMSGNVSEFCEDLTYYTNRLNQKFPRRISSKSNCHTQEKDAGLKQFNGALETPGNGGQGFRIVCNANN